MAWEEVIELGDVVVGKSPGRQHEGEITLFESQGIAIEDVAVGRRVYELGQARGLGARLPF